MNGGPATIDLWDLKSDHANGGPFREIATASPGVRISECLPRLAKWTDRMAIVRSMTSREGDHARATFFLRSGYTPQGAIQFPAFGAAVAKELASADGDLPPFVSITPAGNAVAELGGGFLGPRYNPLVLGSGLDTDTPLKVPNLAPHRSVTPDDLARRLAVLEAMDHRFIQGRDGDVTASRHTATKSAARLMREAAAQAFDLDREKDGVRAVYGRGLFGQGCLLARRLVERGVPFVEVSLGGWDTHSNNFEQVKGLSQMVDIGFAALLADLKERGLLDSTLVVWMGEFGRTPKINPSNGRDHWPNAFSAVLAGGGIKGGQAVGRTSKDGTTVEQRPVKVPDLLATVCRVLGIDHARQNLSNVDRPIRIVDRSAKVLEEVGS
jgi:uncharacterized protein (DUF1501 family)